MAIPEAGRMEADEPPAGPKSEEPPPEGMQAPRKASEWLASGNGGAAPAPAPAPSSPATPAESRPMTEPHLAYNDTMYLPDLVLVFPFSKEMLAGLDPTTEGSPSHGASAVAISMASSVTAKAERLLAGSNKQLLQDILQVSTKDLDKLAEKAPKCAEILRTDKQNGVSHSVEAVRLAVLQDLTAFLKQEGCHLYTFQSVDGDEVFLCVSLGDPTLPAQKSYCAVHAAHLKRYQLQTNFNKENIRLLDMDQDDPDPAYMEYNESVVKHGAEYIFNGNEDALFKQYSDGIAGVHGSIMRTVDRIRLMRSLMEMLFDPETAWGRGLISTYYPVHKQLKLEEFRSGQAKDVSKSKDGHPAWANFRPWTLMMGLKGINGQPLQEIRDYFGERTAFYFLWLAFTITSLQWLVIFFIPLTIYWLFFADRTNIEGQRAIAFLFVCTAFLISVWTTIYTKRWSRLEKHYAALWKMERSDNFNPQILASYRGEMEDDPVDKTQKIRMYPLRKRIMVRFAAVVITLFFVGVVQTTILLVFRYQDDLGGKLVASGLLTAQVVAFQLFWDEMSNVLVKLQNPRNMTEARNLAVLVIFPFSFVSTYTNLVFRAFHRSWYVPCYDTDCTEQMQTDLILVVVPVIFIQFGCMCGPYALYRLFVIEEQWREGRHRRRTGNQREVKRSFLEMQSKRPPHGVREINRDFNIMTILLGYIMLFGAVAPSQIVIILAAFVIKIRIDAFKLCSVYQRVIPGLSGADGIGTWNAALKAISILGRATTIAIPLINVGYLQDSVDGCESTDNGLTDILGMGCAMYNESNCIPTYTFEEMNHSFTGEFPGLYDDADFSSRLLCCACGGGQVDPVLSFLRGSSKDTYQQQGVRFMTKLIIWFIMKELFEKFALFVDNAFGSESSATTLMKAKRKRVIDRFFEKAVQRVTTEKSEFERKSGISEAIELDLVDLSGIKKLDEANDMWNQVDTEDFGDPFVAKTFFGTGTPK